MRLRDYVHPELILLGLRQTDKKSLLRELATRLAVVLPDMDTEDLYQRLDRREAEASTGIGNGVAIPHATIDYLERTVCALVQAPEGVDFGSVDQQPVLFLFVLLSPPAELGRHVQLLAQIARLAREKSFVDELARAKNANEIYELVTGAAVDAG